MAHAQKPAGAAAPRAGASTISTVSSLPPPAGVGKAAPAPPPPSSAAASAKPAANAAPFDPSKGAEAGVIDLEVFGQLLEMDDDDDHNFSRPLVEEYIEQAGETLRKIDENLADPSMSSAARLEFLSGRGHFLKGSSAALGLNKVRDSCEKLQNHGKCKDAAGTKSIPAAEALDLCTKILPQLKTEQAEATLWLQQMCGLSTSAA